MARKPKKETKPVNNIEETVEEKEIETTIEENDEVVEKTDDEVVSENIEETVEEIKTISLDNEPISPIVSKETEEIPRGFVEIKKVNSKKPNKTGLNSYNGRIYKIIADGVGMWTDNGTTFAISDLK